jgi:hypothetical protein
MNKTESTQLPDGRVLGKLIYENPDLWQLRLMDQRGLDSFCRDRGLISMFMGEHVDLLWQIGWLQADLVRSPTPLEISGLLLINTDEEGFIYADERSPAQRPRGWVGAASQVPDLPDKVGLFFHPYRYYVVVRIQRLLQLRATPIQMLYKSSLYPSLLRREIAAFNRFSSKPDFTLSTSAWNRTSAVAILAEPCVHQQLFGVLHFPFHRGFEEQLRLVDQHWHVVQDCLLSIGQEALEKTRVDLCINSELMDPNKDVHTLLRLSRGEKRLTEVRGNLGGSMCLLSMAETLRRAAERAFATQLREEDELGFGMIPKGVKGSLYGSDRPLDAPIAVKNELLRTFGLDFGTRARWYVEGDTEHGAIRAILGTYYGIELVNLRGSVAARAGRGLAFRESLRADLDAHRFSFVSLDGDRSDYLSAIRKALEEDEVCGAVFVSRPDFEFANFTITELSAFISAISRETDPGAPSPEALQQTLEGVKSASEFFHKLKSTFPETAPLDKGEEWGARLMRYAWENPETLPSSEPPKKRPIVAAVEMALGATSANYLHTRRDFRVDPDSGLPVPRANPKGAA